MRRFAIAAVIAVGMMLVPVALGASGLAGKYKTTISGDTALGGALNGVWTIKFKASSKYVVTQNGKVVVRGVDSINKAKLTFHDKSGSLACSSDGKYSFKLAHKKLTFTRIKDPCSGRPDVLSHTFKKIA